MFDDEDWYEPYGRLARSQASRDLKSLTCEQAPPVRETIQDQTHDLAWAPGVESFCKTVADATDAHARGEGLRWSFQNIIPSQEKGTITSDYVARRIDNDTVVECVKVRIDLRAHCETTSTLERNVSSESQGSTTAPPRSISVVEGVRVGGEEDERAYRNKRAEGLDLTDLGEFGFIASRARRQTCRKRALQDRTLSGCPRSREALRAEMSVLCSRVSAPRSVAGGRS